MLDQQLIGNLTSLESIEEQAAFLRANNLFDPDGLTQLLGFAAKQSGSAPKQVRH